MTTAYMGQTRAQRQRRDTLEAIRARLGNACFADFIIDQLSEYGATTQVDSLPALVELWVKRQDLETGAANSRLAISRRVGGSTAPAQLRHVPAWLSAILRAGWTTKLVRLNKTGKLIE